MPCFIDKKTQLLTRIYQNIYLLKKLLILYLPSSPLSHMHVNTNAEKTLCYMIIVQECILNVLYLYLLLIRPTSCNKH